MLFSFLKTTARRIFAVLFAGFTLLVLALASLISFLEKEDPKER
jgi:hypothetical protein